MISESSSLILDVRAGESVVIEGIEVQLMYKSGKAARLRVTAPRNVKIEKKATGCRAMRDMITTS